MKSELTALADFITGQLIREGFVVQRYDACTSDSIYLKLDYGVCNSIRIIGHQGKKHLKYRYNIGPFVEEYSMEKDKFDRFYYRADKAKNMIRSWRTGSPKSPDTAKAITGRSWRRTKGRKRALSGSGRTPFC